MRFAARNLWLIVCVGVALPLMTGCGGQAGKPIDSQSLMQGQLTSNPASVSFGNVQVDSSSSRAVQLSNAGNGAVTISSASTSGPGFRISGLPLPIDLAPGSGVTFNVEFNPSNSGAATGSVQLSNSGASSPVIVSLSGTGTAAPIPHSVSTRWDSSRSTVVGYNVYRASRSGGPYTKLNSRIVAGTSYEDSSVSAGCTYFYVVTAVASNSVESPFSNEAIATVPTP